MWFNHNILQAAGVEITTGTRLTDDVQTFVIPAGMAAVKIWKYLHRAAPELGGRPVLCGDQTEFDRVQEMVELNESSTQQILQSVPAGSPAAAQQQARDESRRKMLEWYQKNDPKRFESMKELFATAQADKPDVEPQIDLSQFPDHPTAVDHHPITAFGFSHRPNQRCVLAICRTQDASEAPAYLRFGGFNDCPAPAIHVAYLRDWQKRFGAVAFGITSDVIELYLEQPIVDKQIVANLAREQYRYSPDIVDQGTGTVERLALELWGSPGWFFWWD
jgi:hypothetical protein